MREPFSVMSIVKSPMGLMVGFMVVVVFLMPKLMENIGTLFKPFTCIYALIIFNHYTGLWVLLSLVASSNKPKQFTVYLTAEEFSLYTLWIISFHHSYNLLGLFKQLLNWNLANYILNGVLRIVGVCDKQIQRKWRAHKSRWEAKEFLHSLACYPLAAKNSSALTNSPRHRAFHLYRLKISMIGFEEISVRKILKRSYIGFTRLVRVETVTVPRLLNWPLSVHCFLVLFMLNELLSFFFVV